MNTETIKSLLLSSFSETELLLSKEAMMPFSQDKSYISTDYPFAVFRPQTTDRLGEFLSFCFTNDVPVITRGLGTGTTGGASALSDAVVISLDRLDRILEIDTDNRMAVVQAGVINKTLQDAVEAKGLFYPPDPASWETCSIGGNVAENAGGPRCMKYGVTGDYVLGLKGVYSDGTLFSFGGKLRKNVAGYDAMRLLIGSEGTLAIITEITLRLLAKPTYQRDIVVSCDRFDQAVSFLQAVLSESPHVACAEFMDSTCIKAAEAYLKTPSNLSADGLVLLQLDGRSLASIDTDIQFIQSLKKDIPGVCVHVAETDEEADSIWTIRRALSPALRSLFRNKCSHDISVPPSQVSEYLNIIRKLSTDSVQVLGYGHLGDGNIHVNILNRTLERKSEWDAEKDRLSYDVLRSAVALGGSISGEHGIGISKKAFMPLMFSTADLTLFRRIKNAFDPKGILNPGKIIDI